VGPTRGHDLGAKGDAGAAGGGRAAPRLVHVITQKGRGFPAGENGEKWHALPPGHDPTTGKPLKVSTANPAYTAVYGKGLLELGTEREDVVVVTAAMPGGTGTGPFGKAFPQRFFDVGIAEGHGVTFAAGLATQGLRPIVTIYSTFLQRGYDNIIHDAAIQHLLVIFAMDRAGLVGEDGETHMGLYDIAYMLAVPGMTVTAPRNGEEMLGLLRAGVEHTAGPFCLRYPRAASPDVPGSMDAIPATPYGTWEVLRRGARVAILAVGTMVETSIEAATLLSAHHIDVTIVNCRYLKPFDQVTLDAVLAGHTHILTVEEGTVVNGFGAYMCSIIQNRAPGVHVETLGVPDRIVYAASRARQLASVGLDAAGIASRVQAMLLREEESEVLA